MKDYEAKIASIAKILDGRIIHDEERVQVCIKGIVLRFPATLEAVRVSYPFGVTYSLETNINQSRRASSNTIPLRIVLTPRLARGLFSIVARLLLLEGTGQKLDIPQIDTTFVCTCNLIDEAKQFMRRPDVQEKLLELAKYSQFTELLIRADAGLCLTQPTSFNTLDLEVCRETFRLLAEIGQIMREAFALL